jgi:DNA helicase-2/ATP-dependent DNA helicase PcrA
LSVFKDIFADQGEGITLVTVHSAKGMEWNDVYIWGWETLMPAKWAKKDWEIEAEKCLQFVAVTRAINNLYLIS